MEKLPKAGDEMLMVGAGDVVTFKATHAVTERQAAMADPGPLGVGGGLGAGLGVAAATGKVGIEFTA
jgi:hypothetical protein